MARSRKRPSSNVKAAIEGSKEVVAELEGDKKSASRFGMAEKEARGGNRRRSRPSRSNGDAKGESKSLFRELIPHSEFTIDKPTLFKAGTGRVFGSDVPLDRILTGKVPVYVFGYGAFDWLFTPNGVPGNNPSSITQLGNFVNSLYTQIARLILSQGKRFLRDTTLTTAADFSGFLNGYSQAFITLRSLESVLNAGNYNYTISLMSSAVMQNEPALKAALGRLQEWAMPQPIVDLLDRLCGVKCCKCSSDCAVMIYTFEHTVGTPVDLTSSTVIGNMITDAQAALSALTTGGTGTDYQQIANLFALAYGQPTFNPKKVSFDLVDYTLLLNYCWEFRDSTNTNTYTVPNSHLNSNCPIVVPCDADEESKKLLATFLRPAPIDFTDAEPLPTATLPTLSGLGVFASAVSTTRGTEFEFYAQNGTANAFHLSNAGPVTNGFGIDSAAGAFPWGQYASTSPTTNYSGILGWPFNCCVCEVVWINTDVLVDETYFMLEQLFLASVRADR